MMVINSWDELSEARRASVDFTYRVFVGSLDKKEVFFGQELFDEYKAFCRGREFLPGGRKGLFAKCRESGVVISGDYKTKGVM